MRACCSRPSPTRWPTRCGHQAEAADRQRAAAGGTDRCPFPQCPRSPPLQVATRAGDPRGQRCARTARRSIEGRGGHKFSLHFLLTEWEQVVDAWQLETWESYRDVARLGRKTRLPEAQRAVLWSIFERVRAGLKEQQADHTRRAFHRTGVRAGQRQAPAVRLRGRGRGAGSSSVAHLRFFARSGRESAQCPVFRRRSRPAHLPAALLVESSRRGYTGALPHPARQLPHVPSNPACRRIACSARTWPMWMATAKTAAIRSPCSTARRPCIRVLQSESEEIKTVGAWMAERAKAGVLPHEFGVFVRSAAQLDRARAAVKASRNAFQDSRRTGRNRQRSCLDQHHASGQGAGVSRRGGHGLRR